MGACMDKKKLIFASFALGSGLAAAGM